MWLPDLHGSTLPTYLALVEAIAGAIGQGELKPGERLPPQRRLAWTLGINPSTVMQAYREAARRLAIRLHHRARVDAQGPGQAPLRRQPFTGLELALANGAGNRFDQRQIGGQRTAVKVR